MLAFIDNLMIFFCESIWILWFPIDFNKLGMGFLGYNVLKKNLVIFCSTLRLLWLSLNQKRAKNGQNMHKKISLFLNGNTGLFIY